MASILLVGTDTEIDVEGTRAEVLKKVQNVIEDITRADNFVDLVTGEVANGTHLSIAADKIVYIRGDA